MMLDIPSKAIEGVNPVVAKQTEVTNHQVR